MAKREPHWVKLFIRELEQTGNVRLAAERAGVDFSTAYQRRRRHAAFAEAWEGALRKFEEAPPLRPVFMPPAPAALSCEEERGSIVRPSQDGSGTLVSAPHAFTSPRWGKRAEESFLLALTVNGNVSRAAKSAGFSTQAVYKRRLKDQRFAAAWDAALETGKARVQSYLVEAATRTFEPDELPVAEDHEVPKVTIGEAINIARLKGNGPAPRLADYEASEEELKEIRARIMDKLQRLVDRQDAEMSEAGWTEHEIPPPPFWRSNERNTVWIPPGYRLIADGAEG